MAHERLLNSGLARALTDLLADLADLVQKEMQRKPKSRRRLPPACERASGWWPQAFLD
jgi:hypothetical protein